MHTILSHLLGQQGRYDGEHLPEIFDPLVTVHGLGMIDQASLFTPAKATTPFVPEAAPQQADTSHDDAEMRRETRRQMRRVISRDRVRRFIDGVLATQGAVRASELPLESAEDIPMLIYVREYGDGSLGYAIADDEAAGWVQHGIVGFNDFVIRRTAAATPRPPVVTLDGETSPLPPAQLDRQRRLL